MSPKLTTTPGMNPTEGDPPSRPMNQGPLKWLRLWQILNRNPEQRGPFDRASVLFAFSPEAREMLRTDPTADANQVANAVAETVRAQIVEYWDVIKGER
jgi:hypothetical protein